MNTQQYLSNDELFNFVPGFEVEIEDLGTTDTYHEKKLMEKVMKFDELTIKLLITAAVQIAIIGAGNNNYGFIRQGGTVITLAELFDKTNVRYKNKRNEKLEDDTLTARRLVRLFRTHIHKFLIKKGRPSYLWIKYSDHKKEMIPYCFPGAEHFVTDIAHCEYLLSVYSNLDLKTGSQFCSRLSRVFIARGLLIPDHLDYK